MEIKHRLYHVPKLCVKRTGVQGYVHFWTQVETFLKDLLFSSVNVIVSISVRHC